MPRKIFKRVGLRRDKNFGDLLDPVASLNNLLKDLVQDTASSFISQDLDCIRNIFAQRLDESGYQQIIGSSSKRTNSIGLEVDVEPPITYQNKIDYFRLTSGEPRLKGGNGLTANYYNKDQIDVSNPDIFVGVTTLGSIPSDNFWENGNFEWTGKFNDQSSGSGGGVEWVGYYVPTFTDRFKLTCESSISYTLEFEKEGYVVGSANTYTRHVAISTGGIFSGIQTASTGQIGLSTNDIVQIGIGMTVVGAGISTGDGTENVSVSAVDRINNIVTLKNPSGTDPILSDISGNSITFSRSAGSIVKTSFTTHILDKFRPYRIRLRSYVHPTVNSDIVEMLAEFNTGSSISLESDDQDINFTSLYSEDYDFSDAAKGGINIFNDTSILLGGGSIGGLSTAGYVKVTTPKKVDIKYIPKTSYANIVKSTVNGSWNSGMKIISCSDTSNIEVGNLIFATGLTDNINNPAKVEQIVINQSLFVDQELNTTSSNVQLTIVDHRGFVKRVTGSGIGSTVTFSAGDTTDLESKMIAIWDGASQYTGITTTGISSQVTISPSQTFASRPVYFYQSKGLIDRSLKTYCELPTVECFKVTVAAGIGVTELTVDDTTGIGNEWKLLGSPFASNTLTSSPTSSTLLTFNNPTVIGIASGAIFTAVANSVTDDKSICCTPTDTSPPFNPTETGLETLPAAPDLKLDGGNLKTSAIISIGSTVSTFSGNSNATIDINCAGTTFKILAAT